MAALAFSISSLHLPNPRVESRSALQMQAPPRSLPPSFSPPCPPQLAVQGSGLGCVHSSGLFHLHLLADDTLFRQTSSPGREPMASLTPQGHHSPYQIQHDQPELPSFPHPLSLQGAWLGRWRLHPSVTQVISCLTSNPSGNPVDSAFKIDLESIHLLPVCGPCDFI